MSYDDYESTADLNEAHYYDSLEADMQMAEWTRESNYYAARRAKGICDHTTSALGHKSPSFYSADDIAAMLATAECGNLGGFTGEQSDIGEGKKLCTACGTIIDDPFAD
jgi:hypothetical protein